jgi:hypothetical protein
MKINGRKIIGPNREIIPIPREDQEDIIFIAEAILDDSEFKKLCPIPTPRMKKIEGQDLPDLKDPAYIKQVDNYSRKKTAWTVLKSLRATEGLVWEMVDETDPSTWMLFEKELKESGFSELEINRIVNGVFSANGLNEAKIDAAKQRFLLVQQARQEQQSSLVDALDSMLPGEPANA